MKLNPEMVILAREYQGLTQEEVAEKSGLTQPRIARVEAGIGAELSEEELNSLFAALAFPREFFYLNEARFGYGTSSIFTRTRQTTAAEKKRLRSLVNVLRIHTKRMLDHVEVEASRPLPRLSLADYSSATAVAGALRDAWRLPLGPIKNLTKLIEGAGVIIIECDFGSIPMDATSVAVDDLPPMIFINRDVPGDRWRFTLAHELAHLVMHDIPKPEMEDEADEFASEFLVPGAEVAPDLSRMRVDRLDSYLTLKGYWGVSIASLIMKAKAMGKLTPDQSKSLFMQMSRLQIRKNEPNPIPREQPMLHPMLVGYFKNDLGFTDDEFARVILFNQDRLRELYALAPSEKPRLRVVR
ncbi:MAG: ImmA/IrrE family metallo-endopeptidase [Chiayiivirga sp.]|uniref:ImmA/IrrE family metallo-endopeptidase n=1 Tax=Chiayiivirga sp. TaxID=2041042 RepID=UPI0025C503FC|nr:ImmA/IrrE family metallo-endopeptidase [Chiayiivirga sp.]MCI1728596.1 ImmA/IrrE family metallo-endopeptidase [Chiayiivirga sp.]